MFGTVILDVAIGLAFVFLLVSIIASAVREGLEAGLKTRAAYLERGIRELLHDRRGRGLARRFYEHPLIYSLYADEYRPGPAGARPALLARGGRLPSYIPAGNFALALMDMAARGPHAVAASDHRAPQLSLANIRASIANIENEPVQRALLTAVDSAQGDLARAQKNIEDWYDSAMDRVSGWYKRTTQWILFWIGLFIAFALNVNPIAIADYLYTDDAARDVIVARAGAAAADPQFADRGYPRAHEDLRALRLPIGWTDARAVADLARTGESIGFAQFVLFSLPGWLLTALAVTFGAPFWFDLLNRMMVIRATVKPREKSPEEASEDRQRAPPGPDRTEPTTAERARFIGELPPAIARHVAEVVAPERAAHDPAEGCEVLVTNVTRDEDLPAAEGGVA